MLIAGDDGGDDELAIAVAEKGDWRAWHIIEVLFD
jgi:hypothetical protein